tara:strand:- start:151 stop:456 length:306 start_codon:yes stop_codon:yes gene_type:complete
VQKLISVAIVSARTGQSPANTLKIENVSSFSSSNRVALLVTGIEIFNVVISVELSNDAVIVIPEFSSKPLAADGFEKGIIARRKIVVNNRALRISFEYRPH